MTKKLKHNGIPMALLQLYQGGDVIVADGRVVRVLAADDLPALAGSHKKWFLDPVVLLLDPNVRPNALRVALTNVLSFIEKNTDEEENEWMHAHTFWQW